MNRRGWLCVAAGLFFMPVSRNRERKIEPPGSGLDPALARLLERIRETISERNGRELEAFMGRKFRVEFDAGFGPAAFRRYWGTDSSSSMAWEVLDRVFSLPGVSFSETLYASPYTFARFPMELDLLSHVVAVRDSVPLRAAPSPYAASIGTLDHSIIRLKEPMEPPVLVQRCVSVSVRLERGRRSRDTGLLGKTAGLRPRGVSCSDAWGVCPMN